MPRSIEEIAADLDAVNAEEASHGILNRLSAPTTNAPTRVGNWLSEKIDPDRSYSGPRAWASAFAEGVGQGVSNLTSPIGIGLTAATGGVGSLAKYAPGTVAKYAPNLLPYARNIVRGAGAVQTLHGGKTMYEGAKEGDYGKVAGGAIESGLGAFGMRYHGPELATPSPKIKGPIPEVDPITPKDPGTMEIQPSSSPNSVADVTQRDNFRRAAVKELREYRKNPEAFGHERAQALADNLIQHLGSAPAHDMAGDLYSGTWKSEGVRTPIVRNVPETRQNPPGIVTSRIGATEPGMAPPLSERAATHTRNIGRTLQDRNLDTVDDLQRTPGQQFRPQDPEAPPQMFAEKPAPKAKSRPRAKAPAPDFSGDDFPENDLSEDVDPIESDVRPEPPVRNEGVDPKRPFAQFSDSDLKHLAKTKSSGTEEAIRELELRKTGGGGSMLPDITADDAPFHHEEPQGSGMFDRLMNERGSASILPEEWLDEKGKKNVEDIGGSERPRVPFVDPDISDQARKLVPDHWVKEWRRKSYQIDQDEHNGKPLGPPSKESTHAFIQEMLNDGEEPGNIRTAIKDAIRQGVDYTRSDSLHDLGTYIEAIKKKNPPPPMGTPLDLSKQRPGEKGSAQIVRGPNIIPKKALEGDAFKPVMSKELRTADILNPGFAQEVYQPWVNGRKAAKATGLLAKQKFADLDALGEKGLDDFAAGDRSGRFAAVKKVFDDRAAAVKVVGVRHGYKENYLPQIWEDTSTKVQDVAKRLTLKPEMTLDSILTNYKKGKAAGLKSKFKNVGDLVGWYEGMAEKGVVDRKMFDSIVNRGEILGRGKAPTDGTWSHLSPAHFPVQKFKTPTTDYQGVLMAPTEIADVINNYLEPARSKGMEKVANFMSLSKNYAMSAGIPGTGINAHGFNVMWRNMMAKGIVKGGAEMAKYMVNPKSALADLQADLHTAPYAVQHGLTLTTEGFELGDNNVKTLAKSLGLRGKLANNKLLDFHDKYFETPLFKEIIPALKLKHFNSFMAELKAGGMSSEQAAQAAAEATNNLYGGINWEAMGRSRDFQNQLRAIFLAPDWLETNLRIGKGMAQAAKNINTPQGKIYARVAKNIMATYAAANVVNYATSGHLMLQNAPGHSLDIEMGQSEGKNRHLRVFGTGADFVRLPLETIESGINGDLGQAARIAKNRVSMPGRAAINILEGVDDFARPISGKDAYGRPIPVKTQLGNYASQAATPFLPQYIRNPIEWGLGKQTAEEATVGSVEGPLRYSKPPRSKARRQRQVRTR